MGRPVGQDELTKLLARYAGSRAPGLQYVVVDAHATLFQYAGGWADLQSQEAMTVETTLMAYSMTKTLTAVAVLQLVEQGSLGLDEGMDSYLPDTPYRGHAITIRQLLSHSAGLPNPIPLRWVHLAAEDGRWVSRLARWVLPSPIRPRGASARW